MSASLTSPIQVVNYALARIGYKIRVGNLWDGSEAAKRALDVYAETRDAMLRVGDWGFAQKTAVAVASSVSPPYPWASAWVYPDDCLRVRNVYDPTIATVDVNNPAPSIWTIAYDDTWPNGRAIWTRTTSATIVYQARVTDPSHWEPLFLDSFSLALGNNLRAVLIAKDDPNLVKLSAEEMMANTKLAMELVG